MKTLFDFFPTFIFFIIYKFWGIFPAIYGLIIASLIQIVFLYFKTKRIEPLHLILFLMILIFGGLTLYFHEVKFLMWKVSLVNWLIGLAMLSSHFLKKNILEYFFDFALKQNKINKNTENITPIPKIVLSKLNLAWGLFFILLGCLNLYIAFHYPVNIWVNFKVFGIIGLTLLFTLLQSIYLFKYLK